MSKPWVPPIWWLRRDGRAVAGFRLSVWVLPEFDQWRLSVARNGYGERILAAGPLRIMLQPETISR